MEDPTLRTGTLLLQKSGEGASLAQSRADWKIRHLKAQQAQNLEEQALLLAESLKENGQNLKENNQDLNKNDQKLQRRKSIENDISPGLAQHRADWKIRHMQAKQAQHMEERLLGAGSPRAGLLSEGSGTLSTCSLDGQSSETSSTTNNPSQKNNDTKSKRGSIELAQHRADWKIRHLQAKQAQNLQNGTKARKTFKDAATLVIAANRFGWAGEERAERGESGSIPVVPTGSGGASGLTQKRADRKINHLRKTLMTE